MSALSAPVSVLLVTSTRDALITWEAPWVWEPGQRSPAAALQGSCIFPGGLPPPHSHGELPPGRAFLQPCGRLSPGLVVHRHPLRLGTEGRAGVPGGGAAGPSAEPSPPDPSPGARTASRQVALTRPHAEHLPPTHSCSRPARSRMCDPENGNLRFDGVRGSRATPPLPDAATAPPRAPPGPAVPCLTPRRRELSGQSVETPRS